MNITDQSKAVFASYAEDAGNWNGYPLISGDKAERGNLTQLKRAGLITTWVDEGCAFMSFTDAGVAYAAELGIQIIR